MHIGSSHNRAAMPFDARVGNEMTYQAAKPTNWQPGRLELDLDFFLKMMPCFIGDYTRDEPEHLRPKLSNLFLI